MTGARDFSLFQRARTNFGNHTKTLSYSTGIKGLRSRSAVGRNMKLDIHNCLVPRLKTRGSKTPLSQAFMTWTNGTLSYVRIVMAPLRHHQCCLQRLQIAKQSSDMTAHNGAARYGHRWAQLTVECRHFGIPRYKVTIPKRRSSKSVVFKHLPPAVTQKNKRSVTCFVVFDATAPSGPEPPHSWGF